LRPAPFLFFPFIDPACCLFQSKILSFLVSLSLRHWHKPLGSISPGSLVVFGRLAVCCSSRRSR
jgi:hypothetical protein